ncbi:hypothetical protein M413DRAFT_318652 [Hebeloma cylindrosporum]|uniref:Uncharacterized protein n=1 Tax=Hebeloma cylindrosporum TaxID=76867 RepID=A0A0C2XE76_HEBCY|nr:hypothetical protein M413DRAFT_318652 [Hebeloma cylindrosporum h7]
MTNCMASLLLRPIIVVMNREKSVSCWNSTQTFTEASRNFVAFPVARKLKLILSQGNLVR